MLPGAKSPDGALYIDSGVPEPDSVFKGGILVSAPGDMHTVQVASTNFVNGEMVNASGEEVTAPGGAIAGYEAGLPRTADGKLVVQLNAPLLPADSFVGGVRVGAAGVHVIDTAPPVLNGFDSGFDSGFGV